VRVGPAEILQLGHPSLRQRSEPVANVSDPEFQREAGLLIETLEAFRERFGFGRAIAAPQIGVPKRFVAANLGQGPLLLVNPSVTWRSDEIFTMWDDCMCFPDLLVRLRRHRGVSIEYFDERGEPVAWERLELPEAELLQHELDHLDGVLAIDRAEGIVDIVSRETFEGLKEKFSRQVDHPPR
jgi:peptide deformylase